MGLGTTLKNWIFEVGDLIAYPFELAFDWGVERAVKRVMPNAYTYFEQVTRMIERSPGTPSLKELVESGKLEELLNPKGGKQEYGSAPIWEAAVYDTVSAIGAILGSPLGFLPFIDTVFRAGWGRWMEQGAMEVSLPTLLEVADVIKLYFREVITEETMKKELARQGLSSDRVDNIVRVTRPLLEPDLIRQLDLRGEIPKEYLTRQLESYGFTKDQIGAMRRLYWIIPGVQDLIRMAVKEAFTPEIAKRFGQYEDFPEAIVSWAEKQGLSREWMTRYWAAHWDLPSASQGFEMLHRGLISQDDLALLLRALDVMPFWRDKLTKIAYSPFTRVDTRRMYGQGVITREEVKRTYLDLGYDDWHAEKLTEWTVAQATGADKDLAKTDILSLYSKGTLSRDETLEYLVDLDYSEEEAELLITREDTNNAEKVKELSLSQIKSLALAGLIDKTEATKRMAELGYTAEDIASLYDLWQYEALPQDRLPTRAELERFYQDGIIDIDTWIDYMYLLRYPEEVIGWYYLEMTKSE